MTHPNIYSAVVFDMHPRVREFLDSLDQQRQIDRDEMNAPYVISIEKPSSSVYRCCFKRNGKVENIVIHTRRRNIAPIRSWLDGDGFIRAERTTAVAVDPRKERARRKVHPFECIVEQLLGDDHVDELRRRDY